MSSYLNHVARAEPQTIAVDVEQSISSVMLVAPGCPLEDRHCMSLHFGVVGKQRPGTRVDYKWAKSVINVERDCTIGRNKKKLNKRKRGFKIETIAWHLSKLDPTKFPSLFNCDSAFFAVSAPFVSGFAAIVVCSIERQKRRQRDTTDAIQVLLITLQLSYITLKRRQPVNQNNPSNTSSEVPLLFYPAIKLHHHQYVPPATPTAPASQPNRKSDYQRPCAIRDRARPSRGPKLEN